MTPVEPLWRPSPERVAKANITRFMAGHRTYQELYDWSVTHRDEFWSAVWRFCGVKSSRLWDAVTQPCEGVRQVTWFPGARLNYADNLLRYQDSEPAIIAWNEAGARRILSHRELSQSVSRVAQALRASGVQSGDRVAGYLPNIPEAVVAMLAAASLGAQWSSCSPDFGVQGVLDRFAQIEPKVLFGTEACIYSGKRINTLERLRQIATGLPSLKQTVVVPMLDRHPDLKGVPHALRLEDYIAFYPPQPLRFEQLPFEHPLYILYSSGTTGLPKCIVHGAGGTLLQHQKEHVLHTDIKSTDRVFYHTTCGWMMWNWLVSVLATGAAIVLFDGSPVAPRPDILWEMAARERVTVFGTSAKYLAHIEKEGLDPASNFDLSSLRTVLSTGSPLLPQSFDYVYRSISANVCLSSISGGTDIVSCFALGNPIAPVYRGELQTRGLGMRVEVFDEHGKSLREAPGELVCHPPFPSMPLYFWNDPEGTKYRQSYFERFPGVWRHGDWAMVTNRDGMVIFGRSDTTLNPGGVRIGTAEIYRQVEQIPEILESVAVGQPWDGDIRIVLFIRLRDGQILDDVLRDRIRRTIRENCTAHHVPKVIVQVKDIPRTLNGKVTEKLIQDLIAGKSTEDWKVLSNPEAISEFVDRPELK